MIINYGTVRYRSENTSNYEIRTIDFSANIIGMIKLGRMLDSFVKLNLKNRKSMWIGWKDKLGSEGEVGIIILKVLFRKVEVLSGDWLQTAR